MIYIDTTDSYANRLNIPYVIILGDEEEKENKVTLKDMETGKQVILYINDIISNLNK